MTKRYQEDSSPRSTEIKFHHIPPAKCVVHGWEKLIPAEALNLDEVKASGRAITLADVCDLTHLSLGLKSEDFAWQLGALVDASLKLKQLFNSHSEFAGQPH